MKPAGRPRLNDVNYLEAVKAFERLGFTVERQKGSHIVMRKPGVIRAVVIPAHRPVAEGTLKACLKAAQVTREQFQDALR